MAGKKNETKNKILKHTALLLDSVESPEEITLRQIAEASEVSLGLINYHFKSRSDLINEAISLNMQTIAESMALFQEKVNDPIEYLKTMLIHLSDIAMKNRKFNKFTIEHNIMNGDYTTCLYLLPILRKIYETRSKDNSILDETFLRLIAYQIVIATQNIYVRQDAFFKLTGIDIDQKSERDQLIRTLIDNLIR